MSIPVWGLDFRANGGRTGVAPASKLLTYVGGVVRETAWAPEHLSAYEPLCFLTYGFNVKRDEGMASLDAFARLLAAQGFVPGAFVWVSWPGDGFGGPLCYPAQEPAADDTAHLLAGLIRDRVRPRQPVSFVAHSLGSRLVLQTLDELRGSHVKVGEVVTMAAAVDGDAPSRTDRYRAAVTGAKRFSVLHSQKDWVLHFAFPAGDLVASMFYGGDTCTALGFRGPKDGPSLPVPGNVNPLLAPGATHSDYLPGTTRTGSSYQATVNAKQAWAAGVAAGFLKGR